MRGDQGLKGFQCLNCAPEADCPRLDAVLGCGLSNDGADEIVSQDVRSDVLPREFGRLATQDVHLQRLLEGPEIEFSVPASTLELRKVAGADVVNIDLCGHNNHVTTAESGLLHQHSGLANSEELW